MSLNLRASICALTLIFILFTASHQAAGGIISFTGNSSDGHAVSGTANFALSTGSVTLALTNTTSTTWDAGELLSGIDFNFGGLIPSLTSKTAIERTVVGDGTFSDTSSAQSLSWSLVSLGSGSYQLNFNPNAKDSIIGPPSNGSYGSANSSINGNNGHNPFAAQTATFVLSVPGLTANSTVNVTAFRFGTTLNPATVPEPSSAILALISVSIAVCHRPKWMLRGL